jgi:ABC-type antimicrobial peptide transport system permease subunit
MTTTRLLLQSILYYWRTNLSVLLGVVAGTAVIGGALIVGDSVRGSLRQMTFDRLGKIDHVVSSHRFFREDLAAEIAAHPDFSSRFDGIAPALVMPGSLTRHDEKKDEIHRSNRVNVYGIGADMWKLIEHGGIDLPKDDGVVISRTVADELRASKGDSLTLWIELPSSIPRDTLLGERDQDTVEITLTVSAVLDEHLGAGRLGLNPNQLLPSNAFVSLPALQTALNLATTRTRDSVARKIVVTPARVNSMFASAKADTDSHGPMAEDAADALTTMLSDSLALEDVGLRIAKNEQFEYLSLESKQQILETVLAGAGEKAAGKLGMQQSPVMIYLANELRNVSEDIADFETKTGYSLYSAVAGVEFPLTKPFGPFKFEGAGSEKALGEGDIASGGVGEIILNRWLAKDLQAKVGQIISLKYHIVGSHGELPEEERRFKVRGIVKLGETSAADRGIVPTIKGITDVESLAEWDQPFPMKTNLITDRDELYWDDYKATPKAFVTLKTAQLLWQSRYGQLTSLRISPVQGKSLDDSAAAYGKELLSQLEPRTLALFFQPVKFQGVEAASGTTDFSGLFIGFSFFLILSATILIGLLFRLGIERRSTNIGLLSAVGFSPRRTRSLFLIEGLLVVVVGGIIGVAAAVGYASLMVYGLKTWWYGAIGTRFLDVYVTPMSLGMGFGISVLVAVIAVWWAMRELLPVSGPGCFSRLANWGWQRFRPRSFRRLPEKLPATSLWKWGQRSVVFATRWMRQEGPTISTRELLSGVTEQSLSSEAQRRRGQRGRRVGIWSIGIAWLLLAAALFGLIPASEAFEGLSWQTVTFFIVGIALLTASLAFLSVWLDSDKSAAVRGAGVIGMGRLGMRNAARHRQRSVLTTGLIASATFVIVAVAAGHRNPTSEAPDKNSGNGGFLLVAESTTPLLPSLNTAAGRRELGLVFDEQAIDENEQREAKRKNELLEQLQVMSFRVKPGEEASCLNIYQTRLPKILGVPQAIIERGGFKFIGAGQDNPWSLLTEEIEETTADQPPMSKLQTIPVFGDMNTLQYSLHKGVGTTIIAPSEDNPQFALKIVGQFDGSVFQGVLLMSEENFRRLFPDRVGYEYFLIDVDPAVGDAVTDVLETGLTDYGFDTERVADRLSRFLAVQNTYLSTFQTLGGLGLLLGTFGLATVMLRNVFERRAELALLRAVGFRNGHLAWLVLWENAFLLTWGLLAGTASALLAMTPHLLSIGADVPWTSVITILAGVFVVGMTAALVAVAEAVRTPILATLRSK